MNTVPTGEVVEKTVQLAERASSLHKTQLRRWALDGQALHLFPVPGRMQSAADVSGRQMIISCGIALDHLHVALAAAGRRTSIAYFPNPNRLLECTLAGYATCPIIHVTEVPHARSIVARLTGRHAPQVLILVSAASEPDSDEAPTP